ncbi:uncharacterized protein LOC126824918 [Patella vulgata]|uniref:uncharacterized protein LOC126824918 n=1 Tax=Patella vulgata TaxID=6465 RepID=UPI0024A7E954|nr:uncharacterized protein LOC126824918 [Patella vulgata]
MWPMFSRTVDGEKIWIDVGTRPDSDSSSDEPYPFDVIKDKAEYHVFKNGNKLYLAVKDKNVHKYNYIEFTLYINNRKRTPVVSKNNCVINYTSNGWCIYNIPDLCTDGIKEGPSVVHLVVGDTICYKAGIIVRDLWGNYIIETSVDLSTTDEKDIKVVFNGVEDDYDCEKLPEPGINIYKLQTAKREREFISLDDWLENLNISRPPTPVPGQDKSDSDHVNFDVFSETVDGEKIWIDVGTRPDSDSDSSSDEPYRFDVNKEAYHVFKNGDKLYLAVKDKNVHKYNYIEFTLYINNRKRTPVVSKNNCVINYTSNGWCIYNIPDLCTDGIKEGPSVVHLVVGDTICYKAGIIVRDLWGNYIIETSVDLSTTDEKDIKVVFNGVEDDYDCEKLPEPGINIYKLQTAKREREFISLDDWLENLNISRPPTPVPGQDKSDSDHVNFDGVKAGRQLKKISIN